MKTTLKVIERNGSFLIECNGATTKSSWPTREEALAAAEQMALDAMEDGREVEVEGVGGPAALVFERD